MLKKPIDLTLPMNAELLILQRKPMRFVDRLIEFSGNSGVVESIIMSDNILLNDDGSLDKIAMVELIAQSFAVIKGYHDMLHNNSMKLGFLVGASRIQFNKKAYKGDRLRIRTTEVKTFDNFSLVDGEVMISNEIITLGTIKIWISENTLR